ncbi:hypothetical protein K402DRAFT_357045 [Aulographum hederae CBS 113979]|uniref:Zinc-ribbon 15 domain-containing protein n=1 Tax=Aulographum hederae CBS 113979 TaxID=1176131 RepID=A0A6G1GXB3_9PEZI|nr:hypothetical protein K402DRAFT_357045 [Aulographum hederae CBS 113979]
MFFFFTCGTHTFQSPLKGYENTVVQCQNCGNVSARPYKRWEWFTFCFVPIIPFSLKPWHELGCHVCNFYQDMKVRPDVTGQGQYNHQGPIPMHNYASGGGGPPPQQGQQYK